MKVFNEMGLVTKLPESHKALLAELRRARGFDAEKWALWKAQALNTYCQAWGIDALVVGLSGGVDSALALGLAVWAKKQPGSPIKKIEALSLPARKASASGQQEGAYRARETAQCFGVAGREADMSPVTLALEKTVKEILGAKDLSAWARGQIREYSRTPALYGATSALSDAGFKAAVLGTTNRDEGCFLGYVGKASDGMNDIQVLADLHKSEVFAAAKVLGVPGSVLSAIPSGGMHDGRVDEEVFGAPYDFVELFLRAKEMPESQKRETQKDWPEADRKLWDYWAQNLMKVHEWNKHKYRVGIPSAKLDILPSAMEGGWKASPSEAEIMPAPEKPEAFIGLAPASILDGALRAWRAPKAFMAPEWEEAGVIREKSKRMSLQMAKDFMLPAEREEMRRALLAQDQWVPTAPNGVAKDWKKGDAVQSWRLSFWSKAWAKAFWERFGGMALWPETATDGSIWRPVGINPLLRVIRYEEGMGLVKHYDWPWAAGEHIRSRKSFLVCLEEAQEGGSTIFHADAQWALSDIGRDDSDSAAIEFARGEIFRSRMAPGEAWTFSHALIHEGERIGKGGKILLRGDVLYARVDKY